MHKSAVRNNKSLILKVLTVLILVFAVFTLLKTVLKESSSSSADSQITCDQGNEKAADSIFCSKKYGFSFEVPDILTNKLEEPEAAEQSTELDESGESSKFIEAEKSYAYKLEEEGVTHNFSIAVYPQHRMYITNGTDEGSYYFDKDQNTFLNKDTKQTIDESQNYKVTPKEDNKIYSTDLRGDNTSLSQNIFIAADKMIVVKVRTQQTSVVDNTQGSSTTNLAAQTRSLLNSSLVVF